jgi:predicted PurR-regulated permease PerM
VQVQARLPTWLLALIVFGAVLVFAPYFPWMVLALWLGLYARRIHAPLTRKLGGRVGLSATLTVSLLLVVALPIAAIVTSIVIDTIELVRRLWASDETQAVLVRLVQGNNGNREEIENAAEAIDTASGAIDLLLAQGDRAWTIVRDVAGMAASFVIGLFIMVTGIYGVLVQGDAWYRWLERHTPLSQSHFRRLGGAFLETGRGLWWGIIGAGTLQATIATIAYIAIGVPSALALGLLTLLFSVVPAIGTAFVWAPVAAGLALTGRPVAAATLVIIGVAVIGTVDNLARPYLALRGRLELPMWLVLTSMFGGIELIGPWGLLMGPLVVRLAKEALIISREAHDPATSTPPVETTTTS